MKKRFIPNFNILYISVFFQVIVGGGYLYAQDQISMLPYTSSMGINPAFAGIMAEKLALRVGLAL